MERKVLKVFIATPGDLQAEREAMHAICQRINRAIGRAIGWQVDLYGWEDTRPGYGRAQEIINRDVDGCDLFVGALAHRWGSDSGKFSSGFEEEFTRAIDRRRQSTLPEIWLYFKALRPDEKVDVGPQLQKVLQFRKEQEERKEVFFREFGSTANFGELIQDALSQYLLELHERERDQAVERAIESEPVTHPAAASPASRKPLPEALVSAFQKVLREVPGDEGIEALSFDDRLRLFLSSSAWFGFDRSEVLLHVHHQNMVFTRRTHWTFTGLERLLLVRSMLANRHDVVPGWHWLAENDLSVDAVIWGHTLDGNADVRKGAVHLLANATLAGPLDRDLLHEALADNDIAPDILKYLERAGSSVDLEVLRRLEVDVNYPHRTKASAAIVSIVYQQDPQAAFSTLIEKSDSVPKRIASTLKDLSLPVETDTLKVALQKASPAVRRFAARYLRKAGLLSSDTARLMLEDTDKQVRKLAVESLFERGEPLTMAEIEEIFPDTTPAMASSTLLGLAGERIRHWDFWPLVFQHENVNDLKGHINFFGLASAPAYQALAERDFDAVGTRVRSDIEDRFEKLRLEIIEKYPSYGSWDASLVTYCRGQHLKAALLGLVAHGEPRDVRFARDLLDDAQFSDSVRQPAVMLIERFGGTTDVPRLLAVAEQGSAEAAALAARAAIRFAERRPEVLSTLVRSSARSARRVAAGELLTQAWDDLKELVGELLNSESDTQRLVGVALLWMKRTPAEVAALLEEYQAQRTYYYSVPVWLDRLLNAPEPYNSWYLSTLATSTGVSSE